MDEWYMWQVFFQTGSVLDYKVFKAQRTWAPTP